MNNNFLKIKDYVTELEYTIVNESESDSILIVEAEESGVKNLVLGCEEPILIMEQYITDVDSRSSEIYVELLKKNRDIIHGAFVLDESGKKLIFRDTLQLENLDLNELEASINSLSLLLSEYSTELINISKIK
tara:strand:+ start:68 stop:466 length:399 start_codon:yes stop_codon:yes gene_type:complete